MLRSDSMPLISNLYKELGSTSFAKRIDEMVTAVSRIINGDFGLHNGEGFTIYIKNNAHAPPEFREVMSQLSLQI